MSARRSWLREAGGAFGDLGTFVPLVVGAVTVAGLAPAGVLIGFGVSMVAAGLAFGIPLAVQPMKAVAAVLLTGELTQGAMTATGLVTGLVLLALGLSGAIGQVARIVPQSVAAGLQLGLGAAMAWLGLGLVLQTPVPGCVALAVLLALARLRPAWPAAPLGLLAGVAAGGLSGEATWPGWPGFAPALPAPTFPSNWQEVWSGLLVGAVPQLPLTVTNALILTALLARQLYPAGAERVTERRLAVGTGAANLVLAPLGAMPMCLGAGGLQAQHRFGARTGAAPVMLGATLLALGLFFAEGTFALLAALPPGVVGALLLVAGGDLATSRRLFDARVDCWPAIGLTAGLTMLVNPAAGLAAGWTIETGRSMARQGWKARQQQ